MVHFDRYFTFKSLAWPVEILKSVSTFVRRDLRNLLSSAFQKMGLEKQPDIGKKSRVRNFSLWLMQFIAKKYHERGENPGISLTSRKPGVRADELS